MAKKRFNWTLAIVLIIAAFVLAASALGLRNWQRNRMAYSARKSGLEAYGKCLWAQAAKNLGRYVAFDQTEVKILHKYAESHLNIRPLKSNNIQHAIAAYRTILRVDKDNAVAASKLVELYLQMKIPAEAELIGRRFLEKNNNTDIQRMLAMALAAQRKFTEAVKLLTEIIETQPDDVLAFEALGRLKEYYGEDFPVTAQYWFDRAIENNPSSAQAYIMRAAFHLRNKDNTNALRDLQQAEKLDLSDSVTRIRLVREFARADALDKARSHLIELQGSDPANPALWQTWAMVALKARSKDQMRKVADTGLKELSSQEWDFMPLAAELYIHSGQTVRARDCIQKLKQKDIAPARVAFLEGLLANVAGQDHQAIRFWRKAMQMGDESKKTQLALAEVLSRVGDKQSAIKILRTLVSKQSNLFEAHLTLARLLHQTGRWAQAAEQIRLAERIDPDNLRATLLSIQIQMRLIESYQPADSVRMWRDVQDRLARLQRFTDNVFEVQLLKFKIAMQREQFDQAERL
ncbi:MAG: tetratricopeptide repeat protein, partial [Planctomycetota bacterium]